MNSLIQNTKNQNEMIKVRNFQALIDVNYNHNYTASGAQSVPAFEQSLADNNKLDMSMAGGKLNVTGNDLAMDKNGGSYPSDNTNEG